MDEERADVVVIGGGPAGTTAATLLKTARPEARIVLLERELFPRHHIGESTLPDANPVLRKLGMIDALEAAGFVRKTGIAYKWRSDRPIFSERFAKGVLSGGIPDHAWQIDRSRYDQLLLERAREVGVEVWQPWAVTQVVREGERVVGVEASPRGDEGGAPRRLLCEHVVDCSGQGRLLGRLLGLANVEHSLGDLAIYRYYDGANWPTELVGAPEDSRIFFVATPAGWIWYIPLSRDRVSVGLVTRRELLAGRAYDDVFDEQLALVPELGPPLADAYAVRPPGSSQREKEGVPPHRRFTATIQNWSYQHASVAGPGYWLAGDAAAFVDPILSSGILLAHRAGLAVANAIVTQWTTPDIPAEQLRSAYEAFYADLTRGFIVMARWWYDQREAGIEDWWRQAAVLSRDVRPAVPLDDLGAFMHFVAGYLTDFRFAHIGPSFGRAGLAICVEGVVGRPGAADPLQGKVRDRRCVVVPRFASVQVEVPYLATFVETDRWWQLPGASFVVAEQALSYRPPVSWDDHGVPDTAATTARIVALLDAVDGQRNIDDVVTQALARLEQSHDPSVRHALQTMAADLLSLGVFAVDEALARVGSGAPHVVRRNVAVRRAVADVTLEERAGAGPQPAQILELRLQQGDRALRYRPPRAIRTELAVTSPEAVRAVFALFAACDGVRDAEAMVQRAARGTELPPAVARDVCSLLLDDLISIGAFSLAP